MPLTTIRRAKIKQLITPNVNEDMEQLQLLPTASENVK